MALLEIAGLSAGYGDGQVLHGLTFTVSRGEFLTVLGQNGSGKTTLLKAVQRLLPDIAGEVRVAETSVFGLGRRAIARTMAYVPQLAEVALGFTVAEAVEMGRYAHQGRWAALSARDAAAVEEALSLTNVAGLRDKQLAHLSGGERQRVFI
ncbi:MAG: ABC transporter ATP-binding protein, partial [Candidatus Aminicenantes bacterium]|nr:ABC transporter ATP-binding protein [Candidatus Aminicenantes bacterium]